MNYKRLELIFELFVFGVVFGVIEDLIAIKLTTNAMIDFKVIFIVFLVALPFAVIGEIIVDNVDFIKIFQKLFKK